MFRRIYVEIGNICNLDCSFCPKTKREKKQMSVTEFDEVCRKIKGHTGEIFLHVMGEPLCHPQLSSLLDIAREHGIRVSITTNGTLINRAKEVIFAHSDVIRKISISLHCIEGNNIEERLASYIDDAIAFSRISAEAGIYTVFRLWNLDTDEKPGANQQNEYIVSRLKCEFTTPWRERWNGFSIADKIFLEYAGIFSWPHDSDAEEVSTGYCYGLVEQIGILVDGTVVPCCLDSEGEIALGNIFERELQDIIDSPRAKAIRRGFFDRKMTEPLCRRCTYARRF